MFSLSDEFRGLSSKIYTFGFLCLAIKFLQIEFINFSGTRIEISDTGAVAGALGVTTFALTFAASLRLARDYVAYRLSITADEATLPSLKVDAFSNEREQNLKFVEKNYHYILTLSWLSFLVEALLPLLLGLIVALISAQDMLSFIQAATRWSG